MKKQLKTRVREQLTNEALYKKHKQLLLMNKICIILHKIELKNNLLFEQLEKYYAK